MSHDYDGDALTAADLDDAPALEWCAECHGQGGWEDSGEEVDFGDPEWVECPKCDGTGEAPVLRAQDAEEVAFDAALRKALEPRSCRTCGCTDEDCRACIERTGAPCSWVAEDLCSACAT